MVGAQQSSGSGLPYPPPDLVRRIGPMGEADPLHVYETSGEAHRKLLETTLPDDWSWAGKKVLDFGCGSGRVIRQFAPEAGEAEFWGCDLDRPTIEWNERNLSPPFHFFESGEQSGLPQDDGTFDLIYAYSVYTHFTDNWAGWLAEHHRVLADGGFLFATFLGEGMIGALTPESWDEDKIGMNPLMHGFRWDSGGPIALNSPWWLRAHWGRGFDLVELYPRLRHEGPSHGIVLARKKPGKVTAEELARLEPDEPREISAMQHHVEQLADETLRLRLAHDFLADKVETLEGENAGLTSHLDELRHSNTWRLTRPLREARQRLRRRGG